MSEYLDAFYFMKAFVCSAFLLVFSCVNGLAQSDLKELVNTEKAFARAAAETGTKAAFLKFLADDGVVFNPDRANGKEVWSARKESPALLSWYPSFADISSSGSIGYTTGPWEYRPKGKGDLPVAFGHFVTLWQKQPNGQFRAVLDIGVTHEKPAVPEPEFNPVRAAASTSDTLSYAGDAAARFFEIVSGSGAAKAYREFAAANIRLLRDKKMPVVGKKSVLKEIGNQKGKLSISKRMSFYGSGDLAYATNTYILTKPDGTTEKGNFVQIWKLIDKRWQIVLDIFLESQK